MHNDVRAAAVASAFACLAGKIDSIYLYGAGWRSIEAKFENGRIDGYDYGSSGHFGGEIGSLYHYGQGCHFDLTPKGDGKFDGYDYGSGTHFEISVRNKNADLFVYGDGYSSYSY